MAATAEAARLTEAHRLAQARVSNQVIARILAAWPLLDPLDIDATVDRWLAVSLPIVRQGRRTSARLAANYLSAFRTLEVGVDTARFTPVLAEDLVVEQVTTSLMVTGPVALRRGVARRRPLAELLNTARSATGAAAMRHTLNGGRDTITATVQADGRALGWARATSGKPCAFCAMLASRGPAYKSEGTADFQPHDSCHCQPEPVYRRDADWPAGSKQYRRLWDEHAAGLSGPDALNAFRRALSAR